MRGQTKIASLQFLRAIAVTLVIHAHSIDLVQEIGLKTSFQETFFYLENWGAIGLDLFFIISGFIMAVIIPSYMRQNGAALFISKRITRILPFYYLISCFAIFLFFLQNIPFGIRALIKSFVFFPLLDKNEFSFPILSVGWSLSYEIYFYALIALMLAFNSRKPLTHLILLILTLTGVGIVLQPTAPMLKFSMSPLLLEFALGIMAAIIYKEVKIKSLPLLTFFLTISCGLFICTIFTGFYEVSEAWLTVNSNGTALSRFFIWGIPCMLLLTAIMLFDKAGKLATPSIMVTLGNASFSAYLTHPLLLPLYPDVLIPLGVTYPDLFVILSIIISLLISILFYKLIETPISRFAKTLMKKCLPDSVSKW